MSSGPKGPIFVVKLIEIDIGNVIANVGDCLLLHVVTRTLLNYRLVLIRMPKKIVHYHHHTSLVSAFKNDCVNCLINKM